MWLIKRIRIFILFIYSNFLRKNKILKEIKVLPGGIMRSRINMLRNTGSYAFDSCPTCGSDMLIKIEEHNYPAGWLEVYECQGCGSIVEKIID
jgi:DNA-directed RNA polymerase subunit RPC12/RpoP